MDDERNELAHMAAALQGLLDAKEVIERRIQYIVARIGDRSSVLAPPKRRGRPPLSQAEIEERLAMGVRIRKKRPPPPVHAAKIPAPTQTLSADEKRSRTHKSFWASMTPEQRAAEARRRFRGKKATA